MKFWDKNFKWYIDEATEQHKQSLIAEKYSLKPVI